jgi:hypothetical protein
MRKLMIVGGIILIVVGFAGTMFGTFSGFSQIGSLVTATEDAARYCNQGETLVEEGGASEYTPGQGYGRSVRYYCESENGTRREVTGEFVQGLFGQVGNLFSGFGSGFPFIIVSMVGVLLLIVGILWSVSRRLSARPQMMTPYSAMPYNPPTANMPVSGQPMTNYPPSAAYPQQPYGVPQPPYAPPAPNAPQDLAGKLRSLEEARNAGLISPSEYQQARQSLLDEMRSGKS